MIKQSGELLAHSYIVFITSTAYAQQMILPHEVFANKSNSTWKVPYLMIHLLQATALHDVLYLFLLNDKGMKVELKCIAQHC